MIGNTLAKAMGVTKKTWCARLTGGMEPGTVAARPRPRVATTGTVTVDVVTEDGAARHAGRSHGSNHCVECRGQGSARCGPVPGAPSRHRSPHRDRRPRRDRKLTARCRHRQGPGLPGFLCSERVPANGASHSDSPKPSRCRAQAPCKGACAGRIVLAGKEGGRDRPYRDRKPGAGQEGGMSGSMANSSTVPGCAIRPCSTRNSSKRRYLPASRAAGLSANRGNVSRNALLFSSSSRPSL